MKNLNLISISLLENEATQAVLVVISMLISLFLFFQIFRKNKCSGCNEDGVSDNNTADNNSDDENVYQLKYPYYNKMQMKNSIEESGLNLKTTSSDDDDFSHINWNGVTLDFFTRNYPNSGDYPVFTNTVMERLRELSENSSININEVSDSDLLQKKSIGETRLKQFKLSRIKLELISKYGVDYKKLDLINKPLADFIENDFDIVFKQINGEKNPLRVSIKKGLINALFEEGSIELGATVKDIQVDHISSLDRCGEKAVKCWVEILYVLNQ